MTSEQQRISTIWKMGGRQMNEEDLKQWLSDFGHGFMHWHKGTIVIDSWHDKEFRRLGGDTDKLAGCFEDNCEIEGAIEDYFK